MAKIEILGGCTNIMNMSIKVDINFKDVESFGQACLNGFCAMTWERENKNKVYIDNIHYSHY